MVFAEYGEKFRRLREQKGLSLSFFEKLGINKTNLSRFERGKTMMSFERIDMMLQEMNVSLAEYELVLNNFVLDFQEEFLDEIEKANFEFDEEKLHALYHEARDSGYILLALAAKSNIEKLKKFEVDYVLQYLKKVKAHGYFDIFLAFCVLNSLSTTEILDLMNNFEQKSRNYYGLPKYRRKILQVAYRGVYILISKGEQEKAANLMQTIDSKRIISTDLYTSVLRRLSIGLFDYFFVSQTSGLAELDTALGVFSYLDRTNLAHYYRKRCEEIGVIFP